MALVCSASSTLAERSAWVLGFWEELEQSIEHAGRAINLVPGFLGRVETAVLLLLVCTCIEHTDICFLVWSTSDRLRRNACTKN